MFCKKKHTSKNQKSTCMPSSKYFDECNKTQIKFGSERDIEIIILLGEN